jgi:hypothetical protein
MIYSAATVAFGWPTSFGLQKGALEVWGATKTTLHTPKKKLSIEVTNVDCVHVNDMYIFEP